MFNIPSHILLRGRDIPYTVDGDEIYVPLKPLCELIGADYQGQLQRIEQHFWLKEHVRELPVLMDHSWLAGAKEAAQEVCAEEIHDMVCIRQHWIYAWLMEMPPANQDESLNQWECYMILWDYFHRAEPLPRTLRRMVPPMQGPN